MPKIKKPHPVCYVALAWGQREPANQRSALIPAASNAKPVVKYDRGRPLSPVSAKIGRCPSLIAMEANPAKNPAPLALLHHLRLNTARCLPATHWAPN